MPDPGPLDPFVQALSTSPALFPHSFDRNGVSFVRLSEADFERASFLDDRILGPGTARRPVPWRQVEAASSALSEQCDFIFHIGHVGSTLLSRLLGAHKRILSLREPQVLRTLAQIAAAPNQAGWSAEERAARTTAILRLLSRRFRPEQTSLVKATSYTSEMAFDFLSRESAPRAIFLSVSPVNFLAGILGAEHSPREAQMLAAARLARLEKRTGARWDAGAMTLGEIAAMGWACEMTALTRAAEAAGERVLWLAFDRFLEDPTEGLAQSFAHLGVEPGAGEIEAILAGPDLRRYSKAPEYAYDANLRAAVLRQGHDIAGGEIAKGLEWLEQAGTEVPAIRTALERYS